MSHLPYSYRIIVMHPKNGFYRHSTHEFKSQADNISEAVISYVYKRPELHDHFVIEADTLAPITFDTTVYLKGGHFAETGKPYPSDQFACTFAEFDKLIKHYQQSEVFHSWAHRPPFCRVLRSKSGKAGEFFMMHSRTFASYRELAIAFAEHSYLNSPAHYFK